MGVVKDMISRPFNYTEKNGYPKILIRYILGINGCERGLVSLQSVLANKNDTSPFSL